MKNHIMCVVLTIVFAGGAYYLGMRNSSNNSNFGMSNSSNNISEKRCALRTNMRKLWSDHVWWTRVYLIDATSQLPEIKETTNRLLANQADIGSAVASYYGKAAGDKLTALLKDHILISADVVAAAKANDKEKLKEADARWHENADEIATFLSSANPNWPLKDMQKMMYDHLKLTTDEAMARLKKDWTLDIKTFEKVFDEIMMMADGLTNGIVKQFPDKF
ncbi:MAG TPA: hypothetical protein VLG50_00925 [Candidatus Saccharimonadales bacterium]|nr:hypothetical protein [Candidatus Saccharimonadales bacterium]